MNKTKAFLSFFLIFFLKCNSVEFHFALVLLCKQGRTAEVIIRFHKKPLVPKKSNTLNATSHQ